MPLPPSRLYSLLVVEPDDGWSLRLRDVATRLGRVKVCRDFKSARRELAVHSFAFVVTNIRLEAYNGLQLVYVVRDAAAPCRAIAYTDTWDVWLAREAQRAGAFYDTRDCLPMTLPRFVTAQLPALDRREPGTRDRRRPSRLGGRRVSDQQPPTNLSPRSPR
jgi:ActR/RegA family two-component response regulator